MALGVPWGANCLIRCLGSSSHLVAEPSWNQSKPNSNPCKLCLTDRACLIAVAVSGNACLTASTTWSSAALVIPTHPWRGRLVFVPYAESHLISFSRINLCASARMNRGVTSPGTSITSLHVPGLLLCRRGLFLFTYPAVQVRS